MMFKALKYRLWQVKQELKPRLCEKAWENATADLSPELKAAVEKHNITEKAHLLRVYEAIAKDSTFEKNCKDLYLKLALVHDIGKTEMRLCLFFKVVKAFFNYDFAKHDIRGAKMLRNLGCSEELASLVENHHNKSTKNEALAKFQYYDNTL
jgi:putative nucleotidyltransferase with HDIG domain